MVADILLFKRDELHRRYLDVILIENKLTSTRFTSNQAEMFRRVQKAERLIKVRSRNRVVNTQDEIIPLSRTQLWRSEEMVKQQAYRT